MQRMNGQLQSQGVHLRCAHLSASEHLLIFEREIEITCNLSNKTVHMLSVGVWVYLAAL